MLLQIFFAICLLVTIPILIFSKDRKLIFAVGMVTGILGFFSENMGIVQGSYVYRESYLWIGLVPIEIVYTYFSAGIVGTWALLYVKDNASNSDMNWSVHILLILGVIFIFLAIFNIAMLIIGVGFLGIWGLMISQHRLLVVTVALITFFADFIIEYWLTRTGTYGYNYGWDIGIAVGFFFSALA